MRRVGFTIIELLVVLATIAIIASLIIPVLHIGRLQAKSVICSSNIKQIQNLLTIHEQQNGFFPNGFDDSMISPIGGSKEDYFGDSTRGDKMGKWWFQYLDYMPNPNARNDNSSILWCPSRCVKDPAKRNILCGNYGVNRSICKDATGTKGNEYVGTPLNLLQIAHPENTLLVVDSGYTLISWQGVTNAAKATAIFDTAREKSFYVPGIEANKQRGLLSYNENDAVNGRHIRKTVNVGYADNHAKRLKAEELFVPEENGVYKNLYQTWVPK